MSKPDGSRFFVSVYNCRVCGCVISSDEGVRRHEIICRLPKNYPIRGEYQQMSIVKFPCPLVTLQRMPHSGEQNGKTILKGEPSRSPRTSHRHRRQSTLRALDAMSRSIPGNSTDDDEEDTTEELAKKKRRQASTEIKNNLKSDTKSKKVRRSWKDDRCITSRRRATYEEDNKHTCRCPVKECGVRLKNAPQLKVHFIMHLENNPYACPVPGCQTKYGTQFHFNRHIDWHMGRHILSCEKCGQTCCDKTKLKRHLKNCKVTSKPRNKPHPHRRDIVTMEKMTAILMSHYAKLESKGLFMEDNVDLDKDDKLGLVNMQRRIKIEKVIQRDPVFLEVCGEFPEFEDSLLLKAKSDDSKKFKCPECSKSYQNLANYKEHYNIVHRNRPYTCSRCGRNYVEKKHLEKHMKYHELTGNNIYMKKMKNGYWKCMKCEFQSKCRQSQSMRHHWFLVHKVTIPNFTEKKKSGNVSGEDSDADRDPPVVKIESEPALEFAMIVPETMDPSETIKKETMHADEEEDRESVVKCESDFSGMNFN